MPTKNASPRKGCAQETDCYTGWDLIQIDERGLQITRIYACNARRAESQDATGADSLPEQQCSQRDKFQRLISHFDEIALA